MTDGRPELRWTSRGDSAMSLAVELFEIAAGLKGSPLLVLPDERLCREVRSRLAGRKGSVTTWVVTPWGLSRELYSRLGLRHPVVDRKARQLVVRRVMEGMQGSVLCPPDGPRPGMVRCVSDALEELLLSGRHRDGPPSGLTERAKALWEVTSLYLADIRSRGFVDTAEVPRSVHDALKAGADLPAWTGAGIYMVDDDHGSFNELLSLIIGRTSSIIVGPVPGHRPSYVPDDAAERQPSLDDPPSFTVPGASASERQSIRSNGPVIAVVGQDWSEELVKAVRDLKRTILDGRASPSEIGLVVPKDRLRDPLTYSVLERYGVPFDQGSSVRVIDIPVVRGLVDLVRSVDMGFPRDVLLPVLSQHHCGLKDDGGKRLSAAEVEQVTREAFVLGGGMDPVRSWTQPILRLSSDPEVSEKLRETAGRMVGPLERLLTSLSGLRGAKMSVGEHLEAVLRAWDLIASIEPSSDGRSGEGAAEGSDLARMGLERLMEAVRSVRDRSVVAGLGEVRLKEVLEMLTSELASNWLDEGHGQGGIRVLSYEDGAGMAFERLYVLSLNEGSMPPREAAFTLLSERDKKLLGIKWPSDRRRALERLCLAMASAKSCVVGWHRTEGGGPALISPFIEGLELIPIKDDGLPMARQEVLRAFSELRDPLALALSGRDAPSDPRLMDEGTLLSKLHDGLREHVKTAYMNRSRDLTLASAGLSGVLQDGDLIGEMGRRFGPEHVWSATRLDLLRTCPYSFMVKCVLGVEELEEVVPDIGSDKLGTIFHTAAERFYSTWRGKVEGRVMPSEAASAKEAFAAIVGSILDDYSYSGPYWEAVRERLLGSGSRPGMVSGFVMSEAAYEGPFRVVRTELKFGMPDREGSLPKVQLGYDGPEGPSGCFYFRGSVDRVDALSVDGAEGFFIWDYKTGSSEEDKDSLQLPLYMLATSKVLKGMLPLGCGYYFVRRPGAIRRRPLAGVQVWGSNNLTKEMMERSAIDSAKLMEKGLSTALDLITMARSGSFKPKEGCGQRYCAFDGICRRSEL